MEFPESEIAEIKKFIDLLNSEKEWCCNSRRKA